MGSVYRRADTWYIDFRDVRGRRIRRRIGNNKHTAEQALATEEIKVEQQRAGVLPTTDNSMTIAELRAKFEKLYYPSVRPATRARSRRSLDTIFARLPAVERVSDLRPEVLQGFIQERRREKSARGTRVSDRTVRNELQCLHRLLNWAVNSQIIDRNPVKQVEAPKSAPKPKRVLTPSEQRALIEASREPEGASEKQRRRFATPYYHEIWKVFLLTGLRRGEMAFMEWEDVDLEEGVLTIPAENAKTGRLERIPLHPEVVDILSRARSLCEQERAQALAEIERRGGDAYLKSLDTLAPRERREAERLHAQATRTRVFVNGNRQPWEKRGPNGHVQGNLHHRLDECVEAAQITPVAGVNIHCFRRTFATELIRAGRNLKEVQMLGRWRDINVLMELYAQMNMTDLRHSLDALGFDREPASRSQSGHKVRVA